jgi:hypothetical protein
MYVLIVRPAITWQLETALDAHFAAQVLPDAWRVQTSTHACDVRLAFTWKVITHAILA